MIFLLYARAARPRAVRCVMSEQSESPFFTECDACAPIGPRGVFYSTVVMFLVRILVFEALVFGTGATTHRALCVQYFPFSLCLLCLKTMKLITCMLFFPFSMRPVRGPAVHQTRPCGLARHVAVG